VTGIIIIIIIIAIITAAIFIMGAAVVVSIGIHHEELMFEEAHRTVPGRGAARTRTSSHAANLHSSS
jgi:flagellar basal body-associated protein FliL